MPVLGRGNMLRFRIHNYAMPVVNSALCSRSLIFSLAFSILQRCIFAGVQVSDVYIITHVAVIQQKRYPLSSRMQMRLFSDDLFLNKQKNNSQSRDNVVVVVKENSLRWRKNNQQTFCVISTINTWKNSNSLRLAVEAR